MRAVLNPQRAEVGETITLSIEINGAQNVPAPAIGNLDGFNVRYVGPSTQISMVNGQISSSVQHRYTLLPLQPGHFTVGPFSVTYEGKQYQTGAFGVDVVAANQPQAPGGQPSGAPAAHGGGAGQALRLTLGGPQGDVFLHQRIPIDISLYVGAVRVGDVQFPTLATDGFSIDKFPQPSQRQQVIDGQTYTVLHFQTTAVPLRAGTLTIGPASEHLYVYERQRRGRNDMFNDPFFDNFFQQPREVDVQSDPLTVNVLPLPDEGKPPGFSGAVGSFTLQVEAAPTQLTAGDPITVHMQVTGSGNLGDASPPALSSTDGFRTYEPRVAKSDDTGTSVAKSFEQVLIPNDARVTAIPAVRFGFFDPQTRHYQTLESQPIALVVRAPQQAPHAEVVAGGAAAPRVAPEEKLGRDIVYIKDDPGTFTARGERWYGGAAFILWQPVPLLLFGAAVWYDRRRQRLSGDVRYARFTRAGKQARQGLTAAEQALAQGNRQGFYDAVSRTMQAYLGAKLDLPPGGIDAQAVAQRGVPADVHDAIQRFFVTCEQIRFAPASNDGDMRGTLALAQEIVKRLERERRQSWGALALGLVLVATIVRAADTPASPQTTFFHANALYKDGQYAAAAQEYEQVLHAGLESGSLYFNLGNAYVKAGARGKAILNYERARRLLPGDPDLEANLSYARSLTGAEACTPAFWEQLAFPLAHRLSTPRLVGVSSAVYTLLLLGLAAYRLWPLRPRWLVYVCLALGVLLVFATTSLAAQLLSDDAPQVVVIADGETPARFEPADNGTVHYALKEGALLRVTERRQGWLQVARCDGRRGWIPTAAAAGL